MLRVTLDTLFGDDHGTFGELTVKGYSFFSLEDEWRDNQPNESCIPAGTYVIERTVYQRYGYPTYEVMDVPDRSRILFHPLNTEEDTEGCIGLGLNLGFLVVDRDEETGRRERKKAVLKSRQAFNKFMQLMGGAPRAELVISRPWEE